MAPRRGTCPASHRFPPRVRCYGIHRTGAVMAVASTITFTATGGATTISGISASASGTSGTAIDVEIPASTTDQLFTIAIDVSELESIFLYTDGALTVETNSSSAPDDTFVFAANKPLAWVNGMPTIDGTSQNPFDADVTALYLTNATGSAVTLRGFVNQSI
jgi:hypothetical protein